MALEHAILVALSERSGSGYELAQRFDRSLGYFYGASHQQIYRTLRRMDEAGWVACERVEQHGRPDKKVYTVSAEGRRSLREWLAQPAAMSTIRDELSVKIRGASHGDASAVLAEVLRHGGEHRARLQLYRAMAAKDFPDPSVLPPLQLHQYLVLRGGIRIQEAMVAWCDEVADALRAGHGSPAASPTADPLAAGAPAHAPDPTDAASARAAIPPAAKGLPR